MTLGLSLVRCDYKSTKETVDKLDIITIKNLFSKDTIKTAKTTEWEKIFANFF